MRYDEVGNYPAGEDEVEVSVRVCVYGGFELAGVSM